MKKRITLILSVLCLFVLMLALASCGHEHAFGTDWTGDDINHWHKCDADGDECEEVSDKAAHTFKVTSTTASSCDVKGTVKETCTVCGYVKTTESAVLGHDYVEEIVAPTCVKGGITIVTCKRDGCDYRAEKNPTPITTHSWIEATCTEPKKCENCPLTEGAMLGHDLKETVVPPTCKADGYTEVTCSRCDYYEKTTPVDRLDHLYNKDDNPQEGVDYRVITKPTCDEAGEAYYICKLCHRAYQSDESRIEIPATGHKEVYNVIAPTCVQPGITEIYCSNGDCDYYDTKDEVPANGHTYYMEEDAVLGTHFVVTLEPTCTDKGTRSYICTVKDCGVTATEEKGQKEIDPLGHDWGEPVVQPWCGNDSNYEYKCNRTCLGVKCEETKKEKAETEVRHTYNDGSIVVAATCCEPAVYKCIACDKIVTAYADGEIGLPTNAHVYDEVLEVVPSTCTEKGYTIYGCSAGKCGTTKNDTYTPLEPHALGDVSEQGAVSCLICNKSYVNVTAGSDKGSDKVCFGCGNDPCTCEGASADWEGIKKPDAPYELKSGEEATITTVGDSELSIGYGLIVLYSEKAASFTVSIYNGEELIKTYYEAGITVIDLYEYETVNKVVITATEDATATLYRPI